MTQDTGLPTQELAHEDDDEANADAYPHCVFTLTESFDDEGEGEEAEVEDIELFEPGEDSAEAFESSEQALDLVAFLVARDCGRSCLVATQPVPA